MRPLLVNTGSRRVVEDRRIPEQTAYPARRSAEVILCRLSQPLDRSSPQLARRSVVEALASHELLSVSPPRGEHHILCAHAAPGTTPGTGFLLRPRAVVPPQPLGERQSTSSTHPRDRCDVMTGGRRPPARSAARYTARVRSTTCARAPRCQSGAAAGRPRQSARDTTA